MVRRRSGCERGVHQRGTLVDGRASFMLEVCRGWRPRGIWDLLALVYFFSCDSSDLLGTMTSSFFFVLTLSRRTSSSLSKPSTKAPAASTNLKTRRATSSALCMPESEPPFVYLSVSSIELEGVWFEIVEVGLEIRPVVLTIDPFCRESSNVLWTPGFWLSRVSCSRVSWG